jgi:hypothetical protein
MPGPYGWETVSTAILENGRFFGASAEHYSIGRYEEDGDTIIVFTRLTQHGRSRTIFGVGSEVADVRMEGAARSESDIAGEAYPSEGESFDLNLRLTRPGDLV